MLTIGLTGGIGSGKSSVAALFGKRGAHIVDFDKLVHELQMTHTAVWKKICKNFGCDILNNDETINRAKLGQVVFNNTKKLLLLNTIVHPATIELWQLKTQELVAENAHAIVFADVPLLFEIKAQDLFDVVVLVYASRETQIKRVMARNNLQLEDVSARLAAQLSLDEKVKLADIVIDNSDTLAETQKQVDVVWNKLLEIEKTRRNAND